MIEENLTSATVEARLCERGIIPVVEIDELEAGAPLLDALTQAGLAVVEITLRTDAAVDVIAAVRQSHPDVVVGAGTVKSVRDAREALSAGAQFIVCPGTDRGVIRQCMCDGIAVLPGVCTPTEVGVALRAGVTLVKFFPAEMAGGLRYLRALAAPYREMRFVPTGGVTQDTLADYVRLPYVAACGGSWIVAPALLRERRFNEIEQLTREALAIVEEARGHAA